MNVISVDYINGFFELAGAILCWFNVRSLLRAKRVVGVYWPVQGFFGVWGLWNLFYYPALGQWVSFVGGLFLFMGNAVWTILAAYYSKRQVALV